jgi:CelD/BcsL family acetyltransferase involved in cellulose biosynthesis
VASAQPVLTVERVPDQRALGTLAGPWQDLVAACGIDPLCNGPAWVTSHAAAFTRDEELLVHAVRDARGDLVALLPFKREPRASRFALARAQFLADGSFDSDYNDVPCRPGCERAVAALLVDALTRERGLQAVVLSMVRRDSHFLAALCAELAARDLPVRSRPARGGALDLPGDFESYVGGLASRMRSKVRQALRRCEEGQVEWLVDPAALPEWTASLYDLHGRRWRAAGRDGSFVDARRRSWYEQLLPAELAGGTLAFCRLVRGGATLALQLGLLRGTTYYQVQEGYDPALEDERPGTQLRAAMVQELVARGVRRYDFMEGFTRHKAEWGASAVDCVTLSFGLPRLLARAVFAAKDFLDDYRASSS